MMTGTLQLYTFGRRGVTHQVTAAVVAVLLHVVPSWGQKLTPPAFIQGSAAAGEAISPVVAASDDAWLVAWLTGPPASRTVLTSYSVDFGVTWTSPAAFESVDTVGDRGAFSDPAAASSEAGQWLVAWASGTPPSSPIGATRDIVVTSWSGPLSGEEWLRPRVLSRSGSPDPEWDYNPHMADNDQGIWLVVWASRPDPAKFYEQTRIYASRSRDRGATWSDAILIRARNPEAGGAYLRPRVATDGQGTWIVAWEDEMARDPDRSDRVVLNGNVYASRSVDDGDSWSDPWLLTPEPVPPGYATRANFNVALATDRAGTWIAAWQHRAVGAGGHPFSTDGPHVAVSTDAGSTWSAPRAPGIPIESGDYRPALVSQGPGRFVLGVVGDGARRMFRSDGGPSWQEVLQAPQKLRASPFDLASNGGDRLMAVWSGRPSGVAMARASGVCDDGVIDVGEECDDGDTVNGDGCDENCTPSGCGNGVAAPDESCDVGSANGRTECGCTASCDFPLQGTGCAHGVCDGSGTCVSTTTTPTTTAAPASTTSTTLPCTTPRCALEAVPRSPACADQTIPTSVTRKLKRAAHLIDRAATNTGRKASKLRKEARRRLRGAVAMAKDATRGRKASLSVACAAALETAADGVAAGLRPDARQLARD